MSYAHLNPDLPHAAAARQHVARRLFARHGLSLDEAAYRSWCAACRDGAAPPIHPGRTGGTIHAITWRGRVFYVVFKRGLDLVVTVLPGEPREIATQQGRPAWPKARV